MESKSDTARNKEDQIPDQPFATADRSAFVYPLLFAFVLPIIIGLKPIWLLPFISLFKSAFLLVIFAVPGFILLKIVYEWTIGDRSILSGIARYIRPMPPGLVYGSDLKQYAFPVVTVSLITINTIIFYGLPENLIKAGVFPPYGTWSFGHFFFSIFTSAFLHGDIFHLTGNMFFLWAFGSAVEPRIGPRRYLGMYFLCTLVSGLFVTIMLNLQSNYLDSEWALGNFHSLGASGSIAGVMGIFVVRCFFAKMTVSFPILFLPYLSIPLRIQGTFLVAFFFAMDVTGSIEQFEPNSSYINYWAHVGGYLSGFGLGYFMKLHKAASKEAVHTEAERLGQNHYRTKDAIKLYGHILEQEPDNEAANKYLFNKYQRVDHERTAEYFNRLITFYAKHKISAAIELVDEHFPKYLNTVEEGNVLLKLGVHYSRIMDLKKARLCLELANEKDGPWQAKAMLALSDVYLAMGVPTRAECLLQKITEQFPSGRFRNEAFRMLSNMVESESTDAITENQ
jgi:membrane associated rhomboid family serine protease